MNRLHTLLVGLIFSTLISLPLSAQQEAFPSNSTSPAVTDNNTADYTPEIYTGKLMCSTLQRSMAHFNSFINGFCSDALRDCEATKNFKELDPKDPLWDILYDQLRNNTKYNLEICEFAIRHYAPDYYANNLKR